MYSLERFGMKLGLEVIINLLQHLGNPHLQFKSIHVAGTNGKGSTCAFLSSILQEAGYKTALYTSPHLVKFNERIQVNGRNISDQDLASLAKKIKKTAEQHRIEPTFFEFTTALAFLYFAQQHVDVAVIETGLGGRLDATNVVHPLISVITTISFDHQKHLGDTLEKIAQEKAGIIKPEGMIVTGERNPEAIAVFRKECQKKHASLFLLGRDYKEIESNLHRQVFESNGNHYEIRLLGEHQIHNALLATLTIELLREKGIKYSPKDIQQGLKKASWPGRLQFFGKNILVDCAHNVEGITTLVEFLQKLPHRKVLVLAIAEDKDIPEMVSLIVPLFKTVILTQGNYKPASLEVLETEVRKYTSKMLAIPQSSAAVKKAVSLAGEGLVVVTGSIYMVGDVLKHWEDRSR